MKRTLNVNKMKSIVYTLLFCVMSCTLQKNDGDQENDRDQGHLIYQNNCATCHTLRGDSYGKGMKAIFDDKNNSSIYHLVQNDNNHIYIKSEIKEKDIVLMREFMNHLTQP